MSLADSLRGLTRVFLDSAPVIYYVEARPPHATVLDALFDRLDQGSLVGVTSPVTLAEALIHPFKNSSPALREFYRNLIAHGEGVEFVDTNEVIALKAAEIRATHGLKLLDSIQLATGIVAGCEAFVTNDADLGRVAEIDVIVLRLL